MLERATLQKQAARVFRLPDRQQLSAALRIAAVLLVVASAAWYLLTTQDRSQPQHAQVQETMSFDIPPGGNRALLTLSDGSVIVLDSLSNGELITQGNIKIIKTEDGRLLYQQNDKLASEAIYNTMTTPRGGQYQLRLSDGTNVWLNASSSITYPIAFDGKTRQVTLRGEGYFEVKHSASSPFVVEVNGMEVQVLGTHFNINAYDDEHLVRTTLLEGKVKISKGNSTATLQPGQQAQLNKTGGFQVNEVPDPEETVAWKNGLFSFKDTDLETIMRQLARWYDLDVFYEGGVPKRSFTGQVFRNLNLQEALEVLELSGVHFRVEGKKVTVLR